MAKQILNKYCVLYTLAGFIIIGQQIFSKVLLIMQRIHYEQEALREIVANFHIYGEFVEAKLMGPGNINYTLLLTMDQGGCHVRYVLQCINDQVFSQPRQLMENYVRITQHLYQKYKEQGALDISRRCIQLLYTWPDNQQGRQPYFIDDDGHLWRCYTLIERVLSLEKVTRIQHARAAAAAFARFQKDLIDLPSGLDLHLTIPRFHDIRLRYKQFEDAIEKDLFQRVDEAQLEMAFYYKRKEAYCVLENMFEKEVLPRRVCHNDTKISNILLDEHSGEGVAVIDLDTVMPGTILYDFGDLGRTSLSNSREDETDIQHIHARMGYFEAMVEGFLQEWSNSLSDIEVGLLAFAPRVMTLLIGLRFLTDYLNGDIYFKTHSAKHNLERTRAHMALVESMEKQEDSMNQIVVNVIDRLHLKYVKF